ncbi:MAG TPA: hypothetical protein VGN88_02350 [Phycisphaerae bacterium]|jgi:hypothetical protein
MIEWSIAALRMTCGFGALCMAAMLAELSANKLPAWVAISVALVPLVAFIFVRPNEMSASVVRAFQLAASIYYFALATILTIMFFETPVRVRGWPIYLVGIAVGAIPCILVLWKSIGCLRTHSSNDDNFTESILNKIPPLRRQQFAIIESAKARILSWAHQRRIPLHCVHFIVPFVDTDFSLSVWFFYKIDADIPSEGTKELVEISAAFLEILRSLDYPPEWLTGVNFVFDSHEHVERDYEGNYFYRLR